MRAQVALLGSLLMLCALLALMPGTPRRFALAETNALAPGATRTKPSRVTPGNANAKPAPPVAQSGPAPFDPVQVRLPGRRARSARCCDALAAKDTATALQIGEQALVTADGATRGRVLWLLARALSGTPEGDAKLGLLSTSDHPLARWAGLRLAERLLQIDPGESLRIAKELSARWAGAFRARVVVALAHYRAGHPEQAEPLLRTLLDVGGQARARGELRAAARRDPVGAQRAAPRCARRSRCAAA